MLIMKRWSLKHCRMDVDTNRTSENDMNPSSVFFFAISKWFIIPLVYRNYETPRILWFRSFFSHRRSWGDLSGLGKDKVGMVDGSTFDAGKAYKGGDGNCGLGKWWKLFTGKMKLLDNYWLRFCCYACSQHCYICSDWSNQYQSIESIITPLNMLSQQSIEATNVSVQLVTSISLVIVTFLQIPSSATCSSPWSSLAACALSVK